MAEQMTLRNIREALEKIPQSECVINLGGGIDEEAVIGFYVRLFEDAGLPIYQSDNLVRHG